VEIAWTEKSNGLRLTRSRTSLGAIAHAKGADAFWHWR